MAGLGQIVAADFVKDIRNRAFLLLGYASAMGPDEISASRDLGL